jgi:hypothetical protein
MRVSVNFEVLGKTIDNLVEDANSKWKDISGTDASLPHDAEMTVEKERRDSGGLRGSVFVRMKVEQ